MAGGIFVHPGVPADKGMIFLGSPLQSVAAASAEHLASQGVFLHLFLGTFEVGTLGLYLIVQFLADDGGMMARDLDPLAFIPHRT